MKIYTGGLMRCCLKTLDEHLEHYDPAVLFVYCKWCDASMVQRNGDWHWNQPPLTKEV
jgi:hypothetical protein